MALPDNLTSNPFSAPIQLTRGTIRAERGLGAASRGSQVNFDSDAAWNMTKHTNNASVSTYTVNNLSRCRALAHRRLLEDCPTKLTSRHLRLQQFSWSFVVAVTKPP